MNEKSLQWRVFVKSLVVLIFAALYAMGGMDDFPKWVRRFFAPTILISGCVYFSRDLKAVIQLPFMFVSLSLGYGADTLWSKILRRLLFGSAIGLSFNIRNLWKKKWLWSGFHCGLCTVTAIVLGVWNPMPNARTEEFLIALIFGLVIFSYERD